MTDSRTDEELLQESQQQAKNLAEQQEDDLRFVMQAPQGRRFVWGLLSGAGVFQSSFTGDNNATNFNEGRRSEGLRLFTAVMATCPDLYLTMANEASKEKQ
ncbi:hypothetical protein VRC35_11235 [Erwinia aphidicola]|uniref:Bbp19 family protein n=1 Tax=Erwinia aphidicola TaxID=68334 RepID=UPI0030D2A553